MRQKSRAYQVPDPSRAGRLAPHRSGYLTLLAACRATFLSRTYEICRVPRNSSLYRAQIQFRAKCFAIHTLQSAHPFPFSTAHLGHPSRFSFLAMARTR